MEEFDSLDVWRRFHRTLRQYSRDQVNIKVLSRIDFVLVSNNPIDIVCTQKSCLAFSPIIWLSPIWLSLLLLVNQFKGVGFGNRLAIFFTVILILIKLTIKEKIIIHYDSSCNPNIL